MRKLILLPLLLCCLIIASVAGSDELRRKGSVGIQPAQLNESTAKEMGMEEPRGILIRNVFTNGTADGAGVEVNDVLLRINNSETNTFRQLQVAVGQLWGGDDVSFTVLRKGEELLLKGTVVPRPYEASDSVDVIYDSVGFQEGKLRVIVTKPKGSGRYPAILFIPGYPCTTIDNFSQNHPYRKLIYGITERGYAVLRVEKPGMGDSVNTPPCFQIDILTETKAFERGFEKMISYDFVDKNGLFIFGHSMGGISAPVVASKFELNGVIVYGTTHKPWYEYMIEMMSYQNPRLGGDFADNDDEMREAYKMLYEYFVNMRSPAEIVEADSEFGDLFRNRLGWDGDSTILSRRYNYWQSINELNLSRYWKNVDAYVLSIYGEGDIEALNSESHRAIAEMVNHYHPGKGTFHLMPRTGHGFSEIGTRQDNFKARLDGTYGTNVAQEFNYKVIDVIDEWMKSVMNK